MPYTPITDADRAAWRAQDAAPAFSSLLDDTMAAVGAAPAAPESALPTITPKLPRSAYRQLAGAAAIVGLMALAAFLAFRGSASPAPLTDRAAPTAAVALTTDDRRPTTDEPATITAYWAPAGTEFGPIPADSTISYRHSDYPEWGGVKQGKAVVWIKADPDRLAGLADLAPPTPVPTPIIIYADPSPIPCDQATNPRYTAALDVSAADGRPLGQVTGASCDSQALAQADAEQRAAELREKAPAPCPVWHPPLKKPDCVK